jgi:hypothetical protein
MRRTVQAIRSAIYKPLDFIGEFTDYGPIFKGAVYFVVTVDKPLRVLLRNLGTGHAV